MDVNMDERIHMSVDLLIALVVQEIAEDDGRDPSDVLPEFISSQTAKLLYDEDSKAWWDGPSAVADAYRTEVSKQEL